MAQINKPDTYFNTKLYTGDGTSSRNITGVGFDTDFVWIKNRSIDASHFLGDRLRGDNKNLNSNSSAAEEDNNTKFRSLVTDGFQVGSHVGANGNGNNIVAWNWLANGTGVSNTDGSITSTVSANTTSGFSIVSYSGNSSASTVGHGLGVAPSIVLVKNRTVTGHQWTMFNKNIAVTDVLFLDSTDASFNPGDNDFQDTAPTSSVFSITGTEGRVNGSGKDFIAYCFAEKKGFSKFGSYTGNGSADGTFIYTGFKPAMIITKQTNVVGGQWYIYDSVRNKFNLTDKQLFPNLSNAESTGNNQYDFYSNGFKARSSNGDTNASGGSYIYMAFASEPLVGTNNIPAVAR